MVIVDAIKPLLQGGELKAIWGAILFWEVARWMGFGETTVAGFGGTSVIWVVRVGVV